jgi:outer membrane protein assembly factor BamE (lipoprotein component of BamABCDE complex)
VPPARVQCARSRRRRARPPRERLEKAATTRHETRVRTALEGARTMARRTGKAITKAGAKAGLTGLAALLLLAACEPKTAIRGNLPRESQLQEIRVGQDSKSRVRDILGTPSTIGTFDQDVWYYMSQKTEQWAFFEPEIVDHKILALYFDANDRNSSACPRPRRAIACTASRATQ